MIRRWLGALAGLTLGLVLSSQPPGSAAASRDQDAVLNLWATAGDTRNPSSINTWIGSGFLVDATGQFLTCYHVIHGAQKLTVYRGQQAYQDVQVVAIAPDHDLALLQIANLPPQTPFLRLSNALPGEFMDEELKVHGSPGGVPGQQFPARVTGSDYVPSGQLRSPQGGGRIFQLLDVKLIPLTTTVYKGLSGGPVVSRDGVVGVLSGSWAQGGSFAWAIPTMYAAPAMMKPVRQPVARITSWPELSLMAANSDAWDTLRFGVSLTAGLSWALDAYVSGLDEFSSSAKLALVDSLDELVGPLEKAVAELAAVERGDKTDAEATTQLNSYMGEVTAINRRSEERVQALRNQQSILSGRFDMLRVEAGNYQRSLPNTPQNQARAAKADQASRRVGSSLLNGGLMLVKASVDFERELMDIQNRLHNARTLRDVRRTLVAEQKVIREGAVKNSRLLLTIEASYREIGTITSSLLNAVEEERR